LFGGFIDDEQTSPRLTMCILGAIQNQNDPIHLCSAYVTGKLEYVNHLESSSMV